MKKVSVIIPAYNEAANIEATLQAVRRAVPCDELIVVDDGSQDDTVRLAKRYADHVCSLPQNYGKGTALQIGWRLARGEVLLLLDGDLKETAAEAHRLVTPVLEGHCDMAIAAFPRPKQRTGFGLAKGLARHGIKMLTGFTPSAPLSGQRAIRREVLAQVGTLDHGFGIEVGLTVDVLRAGYKVQEVPVEFSHRQTGNDLHGFMHRGKEFVAIGRALSRKWRESW
ncbi:glycosyltransferase family 2 protein [Brevibacillus dissolubilis]|uniref:glycosyltransferase family 2 protein n=1 Tax=Brevibacillus dissolubilis TaxID=1844116 RepID=UPI001116E67D|nr:glycosyltransferase family 2 protein [Brevibacillus dissolubilis]